MQPLLTIGSYVAYIASMMEYNLDKLHDYVLFKKFFKHCFETCIASSLLLIFYWV